MRILLPFLLAVAFACPSRADEVIRIMAANTTSGNLQSYDAGHGNRIFRGLKPDIALVQEMNFGNNTLADFRAWVDANFGTGFSYFRETGAQIPNGIVSRFPILASGEWNDSNVSNRDFAWARIDIPGDKDLWAVSVHFLTTSASERRSQANLLLSFISANVPAGDYLVVGGDLNTDTRTESCISALSTTLVTDSPWPVDQFNNSNTNASRSTPYDWVLADADLNACKTPLVIGSKTFANGLVFDSRNYTPLSEVPPILKSDSDASNMQHMAVLRDFLIPTDTPPITATISLGNLTQTYDGSPKVVSSTTVPSGLSVATTYNGSAAAPTNAGTYAVQSNITTTNHTGSANGTLTIFKANATITVGNLTHTFDGSPKSATAATAPSGLSVSLSYNASTIPPTTVGNYSLTANITETNYTGSATATFSILAPTPTPTPNTAILFEDFATLTAGGDATSSAPSGIALTSISPNFPTATQAYAAGGTVKLGSASQNGSITSKPLNLSGNNGNFTIKFKVKGWTTITAPMRVTAAGQSQNVTITSNLTTGYEFKTLTFSGGTANATVKFETLGSRAFLDDILVEPVGVSFAEWLEGSTSTPDHLKNFAIGGASSPNTPGEPPTLAIENGFLSLTAVIRTSDAKLGIHAESTTDLMQAWTTLGITSTLEGVSQINVPTGNERRKFATPTGQDPTKFLRLQLTLSP